jgi:hypothetical protein
LKYTKKVCFMYTAPTGCLNLPSGQIIYNTGIHVDVQM